VLKLAPSVVHDYRSRALKVWTDYSGERPYRRISLSLSLSLSAIAALGFIVVGIR